ncbi:MAG: DUF2807 domain-containing protein [Cyclobacteriaceae bacterium]
MSFIKTFNPLIVIALASVIASCTINEDPGPIQYNEQPFAVTDFDRLDIGDAMYVTVTRGNLYSVQARGDRRNLDDLEVSKVGNTLVARFSKNRNRKHTTYINISMPELVSANFYGATTSAISGFETESFSMNLSGASVSQLDIVANESSFILSGASNLSLSGSSAKVSVNISGASLYKAYNLEAEDVDVNASGASHGYVRANHTLVAEASGASSILYRGDATVSSSVSGASTIMKD